MKPVISSEDIRHALTLHGPWAWAVFNAGKDVENRTWKPPHVLLGNQFLIHAGAEPRTPAARQADADARLRIWHLTGKQVPRELPYGHIMGAVRLRGYEATSSSVWWIPEHVGWMLAQPLAMKEPISARGALNLWDPRKQGIGVPYANPS
jgi:hypothetical protein